MQKIFKNVLLLFVVQFFILNGQNTVRAQAAQDSAEARAVPKEEQSVTHHSVNINGRDIKYTATAGNLLIKGKNDKPVASIGYVAYTKEGEKDPSKRPVTFAYNGGPGSSSIWLHMGAVGPRRVVINDPEVTPPAPYQLTNNQYSILDATDIVMVDPVGTGISKAVGKAKNKEFWGVNGDISSVSRFIKAYISMNNRWNSPKYLLGESYGTTRSAGVADYLQQNEGIALNGVVLVSNVLDLRTLAFGPGDDLPYILYLPTYAAVAWYHDQLHPKPDSLEAFLQEVRNFAAGPYADALMQGDKLPDTKRNQIINKLSEYTGLSKDYLDKADMRVTEPQFTKELLRDEHKTVGRLDSRYTGISKDLLAERAHYDPQSSAISPAFITTFLNYYHNQLNFGKDKSYHISAYSLPGFDWNWEHGGHGGFPTSPTTAPDLADAMTKNPNLKVLVLNGYFDLATPFFATEYTFDHMELDEKVQDNVTMKYFDAGHMMYLHLPSLKKFHSEVTEFIRNTDRN